LSRDSIESMKHRSRVPNVVMCGSSQHQHGRGFVVAVDFDVLLCCLLVHGVVVLVASVNLCFAAIITSSAVAYHHAETVSFRLDKLHSSATEHREQRPIPD
jgi:hypothetical protein